MVYSTIGRYETPSYRLMGTNIHRVPMLEGVLLFRKLIAKTLIGTSGQNVLKT